MVALKVKGFFLDQDKMPVAMLIDESGRRLLPVRTGPSEASAIIVELQAIRPPQPVAHDLLAGLFQRHGFQMERLEIGEAADPAGYAAAIVYRRGLHRYRLRARASDGLALAVRLGAPILASEQTLTRFGMSTLEPLMTDAVSGVLFLSTEAARETWARAPAQTPLAGLPFN
jgi:bifunctional DNase/RNase